MGQNIWLQASRIMTGGRDVQHTHLPFHDSLTPGKASFASYMTEQGGLHYQMRDNLQNLPAANRGVDTKDDEQGPEADWGQ